MHVPPPAQTAAQTAAPGKSTAIETVHAQLRERVISGAFEPGERLHVDRLRLEFGVSTSTMREAISRLLIDSLVISEQQRGFRVAPLSLKDFRDITDARKMIEERALRDSLAHRSDDWEAELVGAYHRLSTVEHRLLVERQGATAADWDARNAQFHECLVKNCTNAWLVRFRRTLHQHSYRYHRMVLGDTSLRRDVRAEHAGIFESAMAGDVELCVARVDAHIEATYAGLTAQNRLR